MIPKEEMKVQENVFFFFSKTLLHAILSGRRIICMTSYSNLFSCCVFPKTTYFSISILHYSCNMNRGILFLYYLDIKTIKNFWKNACIVHILSAQQPILRIISFDKLFCVCFDRDALIKICMGGQDPVSESHSSCTLKLGDILISI